MGECDISEVHEQTKKSKCATLSKREEDENEWKEVKCPICLDHPHNAVLLRCSSHKKGCRPYMCNTGRHHSNCLNLFYQKFSSATTAADRSSGKKSACSVKCPMCRGKINGWKVMGPARTFMNSKTRSCSCEGCEYKGNYSELRQHVRSKHQFARPAEPDPRRVREWARRVSQWEYNDAFNIESYRSDYEDISGTHELVVDLTFISS